MVATLLSCHLCSIEEGDADENKTKRRVEEEWEKTVGFVEGGTKAKERDEILKDKSRNQSNSSAWVKKK